MIENLFWPGFVGAVLALVFALIQLNKIMGKNPVSKANCMSICSNE